MRAVVDTGVFSASLSTRRRAQFDRHLNLMIGRSIYLATQTLMELRFGALFAQWGEARIARLDSAIAITTVVPVSPGLIDTAARLRLACRKVGHPLHDGAHGNDLWIAASAVHIGAALISADEVFFETPGLQLL